MARRERLSPARDGTVSLSTFLAQEGFGQDSARDAAVEVLTRHGLTRPGKQAIHASKLPRAREALRSGLLRLCAHADCRRLGSAAEAAVIAVDAEHCEVCGGSVNQRAVTEMAAACRASAVDRLLIVGGTPALERALESALHDEPLQIRFVRGTEANINLQDALFLCRWASLVVIWAPTPLPHKVSNLFSSDVCDADRVVVHRRGLAALAGEVVAHFERQPGSGSERSA